MAKRLITEGQWKKTMEPGGPNAELKEVWERMSAEERAMHTDQANFVATNSDQFDPHDYD